MNSATPQPVSSPEEQREAEAKGEFIGIIRRLAAPPPRAGFSIPGGKHREQFIPIHPGHRPNVDPSGSLTLSPDRNTLLPAEKRIRAFERIAEELHEASEGTRPLLLKGQARGRSRRLLRHGDLVHFRLTDEGQVHSVAISSIWREDHGQLEQYIPHLDGGATTSTDDQHSDLLPFVPGRRQLLTLAEQVFGFVAGEDPQKPQRGKASSGNHEQLQGLAGRVRFSFGRRLPQQADESLDSIFEPWTTLKILSSPKPPCPPLYFKKRGAPAENDGYVPKQKLNAESYEPMGRKFYLHHGKVTGQGEPPWKTRNEKNNHQKMRVRPVQSGQQFVFHVDFENLTEPELAVLCYALRPTDKFCHKLGLGKPLGLGTVRVEPLGLFLIDRHHRYRHQDPLDSPRYTHWAANAEAWRDTFSEQPTPTPADLYRREAEAVNESDASGDPRPHSVRAWADHARGDLVPPDIRTALETIGDPDTVGETPVHYPKSGNYQPDDPEFENNHYEWFQKNEGANNKEGLTPIDTDRIRSLSRYKPQQQQGGTHQPERRDGGSKKRSQDRRTGGGSGRQGPGGSGVIRRRPPGG